VLLSDADREVLFEKLAIHAAAGRLGIEALELRVAAIAAAETREQAAAVMADLPPVDGGSPPEGRPHWGTGHGEAPVPAPDWHPTNERFRDPGTTKVMRVWVDTAGGRHYVADDAT
jgi:hypothetical protein